MSFEWDRFGVTEEDKYLFSSIIGSQYRAPDLIIDDDGSSGYLYRWWLLRTDDARAGIYAHIQVASDPARPLHDHPWDNMSVILSGGYEEKLCHYPMDRDGAVLSFVRKKGDTIFRKAEWAHRLILPANTRYTMTVFSFGPKVKKWGFWHKGHFTPHEEWLTLKNTISTYIGPIVED